MNVTVSLFQGGAGAAGEAPVSAQGAPADGQKTLSGQGVGNANPFALLLSGQLRGAAQLPDAEGLGLALGNGKLAAALAQLLPQDGKALPSDSSDTESTSGDGDSTKTLSLNPVDLAAILHLQQDGTAAGQQAGQDGSTDWTVSLLQLATGDALKSGNGSSTGSDQQQGGDDQAILRVLQGAGLRAEVDRAGVLLQHGAANPQHHGEGGDHQTGNQAPTAVAADPGIKMPADLPAKTAAVAQSTLQQPVGKQGWDQELGSRMVWMSKQDLQSAQLRLNPAHLGPLEVRLSVQQDHSANVAFLSNHAPVREAVEAAIPRLREMLADNGFNLTNVDVSSHSHGQARDQHTPAGNWLAQADGALDATSPEDVAREVALGLVDYFA